MVDLWWSGVVNDELQLFVIDTADLLTTSAEDLICFDRIFWSGVLWFCSFVF